MTLDEAIKHCEEKAEELKQKAETDYFPIVEEAEKADCLECAKEHEQLASWLKELKEWREIGKACVDKGICVPIILSGNIVPDMLQGWKYEQKNNT